MSEQLRRVEKAMNRLLIHEPFWASLALRMKLVEAGPEAVTAFTDGERIVFNREFTEKLPDDQLGTLIAHEVSHPALGHLWRKPAGYDYKDSFIWQCWQKACDNEVNLLLQQSNDAAGRNAVPFPFPTGEFTPEMQDRFKGKAAEIIFKELISEKPPKQPQGGSSKKGSKQANLAGGSGNNTNGAGEQGNAGKSSSGANNSPSSGQGDSTAMPNTPDPQTGWGEFIPSEGNKQQQKEQQREWEEAVIQATVACKHQGSLPAHFKRLVDAIINPTEDWKQLTDQFLRERATDDYSFRRPNMKFHGDFIMPVLDSERVGVVMFAVDTSGSIDDKLLGEFKGKIQDCLDELNPKKVVVICCDARVQSITEYIPGDTVGEHGRDFTGGGGTVFQPVWDKCEMMEDSVTACIFLTDMYANFGKEPPFPVLWLTKTEDHDAPFGKTVRMQ